MSFAFISHKRILKGNYHRLKMDKLSSFGGSLAGSPPLSPHRDRGQPAKSITDVWKRDTVNVFSQERLLNIFICAKSENPIDRLWMLSFLPDIGLFKSFSLGAAKNSTQLNEEDEEVIESALLHFHDAARYY